MAVPGPVIETDSLMLPAVLYAVQDVTWTPVGGHVRDHVNHLASQSHTNKLNWNQEKDLHRQTDRVSGCLSTGKATIQVYTCFSVQYLSSKKSWPW